ncbi:MAG TPA: hypothetical protein VJ955_06945 [Desulfuromonadales bacterium]|nr:hypothetical protein [Desulfuromonadales bacterium]
MTGNRTLHRITFAFLATLLLGGIFFSSAPRVPVHRSQRPAIFHASVGVLPAVLDSDVDQDKTAAPVFLCHKTLPVPVDELWIAVTRTDQPSLAEQQVVSVHLSRPPPRC